MTAAQASVGRAAAWPTIGTILMPAEAMRHGAASTPQPESMMGRRRAAARSRRRIMWFCQAARAAGVIGKWTEPPIYRDDALKEQAGYTPDTIQSRDVADPVRSAACSTAPVCLAGCNQEDFRGAAAAAFAMPRTSRPAPNDAYVMNNERRDTRFSKPGRSRRGVTR